MKHEMASSKIVE